MSGDKNSSLREVFHPEKKSGNRLVGFLMTTTQQKLFSMFLQKRLAFGSWSAIECGASGGSLEFMTAGSGLKCLFRRIEINNMTLCDAYDVACMKTTLLLSV